MFNDDLSSVNVCELTSANNWQMQYRLITQWGKLIQPKSELRNACYLIKGCETSAWLAYRQVNELCYFAFDSDSRVINGLAAFLLANVNNKTKADINTINFSQLLLMAGLEKHLTPSRNNGLHAIIAQMLVLARAG
jgi:cysteine desulfuration protein SufE